MFRGRVETVQTVKPRGFLASDQAAGTTALQIYGGDNFVGDTSTGSVVIDDATYTYTISTPSVDEAVTPSTLTITPGLVADEISGEPVELVTTSETKFAGVSQDDSSGDVMSVLVPHSLIGYAALSDGSYNGDDRATVDVTRNSNGQLVIADIVGLTPQFDGSLIDPSTTIPSTVIGDDYIYTGSLSANQITAGVLNANLGLLAALDVGGYVVVDGVTSSITIYADLLHTVPLVQLRPDGSVFQGRIIATDISVLNGLILMGLQSQIAQGAAVTLQASVADPAAAPTLASVVPATTWPAPRSGYAERGIYWDATSSVWLRLLVPTSGTVGGRIIVEQVSAAGAHVADITLANVAGVAETDANGIVRIGSSYYTALWASSGNQSILGQWSVTTGALQASNNLSASGSAQFAQTARAQSVSTDGTYLQFAYCSNGTIGGYVQIDNYTSGLVGPSTNGAGVNYWTTAASLGDDPISYIAFDNFDFGSARAVIMQGSTAHVFTISGSGFSRTLTEDTTAQFSLVADPILGGVAWNGTSFYSTKNDSKLYRYSSFYPTSGQNAYVTYYDQDSGPTHWTLDSPVSSTALQARRFVQAALPPTGSSTSGVLMGIGTTQPADSALLQRSETLASRVITIDPSVAGGATHPTLRTVTNKALASNVATLTTSAAHGYSVGSEVLVSGVDATFNGTYVITTVGSTTTFSYLLTAANVTSVASGGLVEANTFGAGTPGVLQSQTGGLVARGDGTGAWPLRDDRVTQTLSDVATTGEQIVAQWAVPAGYFKSVSDMAEATIVGQITGTATVQWRVRMGPLGTTADTLMKLFTTTPAATANQFWTAKFQLLSVIQSSVLTVSCLGFIQSGVSSIVGPTVGTFAPAAVDTTVPNYITVTAQLSAGSQTLSPKSASLTKSRG